MKIHPLRSFATAIAVFGLVGSLYPATPTPTLTPCPLVVTGYTGQGHAGDIALSLRTASTYIVGLDTSPGGTYYPFADMADAHLDGLTADHDDISMIRVSREDSHDIVEIDGGGAIVPGSAWTLPVGSQPKIGAFDPISGDYYVPDLGNHGLWSIKHGTSTPVLLPGSTATYVGPLCATFDGAGNLYLSDSPAQKVFKYTAASLAAWHSSSVAPTPTVYASMGIDIWGLVYDGGNHIYAAGRDGGGFQLVDILMGPTSGTLTGLFPVWPAIPNVPLAAVGTRVGDPDGMLMDLEGKLWVTQNNTSSLHGLVRMDVAGNVLDWRPLTQPGTPDDVALLGLRLPRPPYSSCGQDANPGYTPIAASPTPSRTPTPTASITRTATPSPSVTQSVTPVWGTATCTPSPTRTATPSSTQTQVVTAVPTVTPTPEQPPIRCPYHQPGDGRPQKVVIHSKEGGHCSVKVYRPEGRPCRHLWEGNLNPGEVKVLLWDEDDETGQRISSGIYMAVFRDGDGEFHRAKIVIVR